MTSEQRIAEWAEETWRNVGDIYDDEHSSVAVLESAARTLIASVRAEAIEECAKVCCRYCRSGLSAPGGMHSIAKANGSEAVECPANIIRRLK